MFTKKTINIIILVLMLLSMTFNFAFAGIMEDVDKYARPGGAAIREEVDNIGTNLVGFARGVFSILGVIFVVWAGFVWWGAAGDPNKLMFAKRMLAGFVICMICVFYAEKIVGGLLGLFDYNPSSVND